MYKKKRNSQTNVVINDKSQGSVATHLRRGEIFNSHILTNLLLSLPVTGKKVECLMHFVCLPPRC